MEGQKRLDESDNLIDSSNITVKDIKKYCEVSKTLQHMGNEFLMELRHATPLCRHDILGISKIDAIVENVTVSKDGNIMITIYDLFRNTNKACLVLDTSLFLESRKKCAEDCYNNFIISEEIRREEVLKAKEIAEYERIKAKYNL